LVEDVMEQETTEFPAGNPLAAATTRELLGTLASQSGDLVRKEIELAKSEIRFDLKREFQVACGFAVAAVCALAAFDLLVAAVVLALAGKLPAWAAALIVAGAMLVIGALGAAIGWRRRAKRPLDKTQRTLREDARWLKRVV
jgi:hypothetical protein